MALDINIKKFLRNKVINFFDKEFCKTNSKLYINNKSSIEKINGHIYYAENEYTSRIDFYSKFKDENNYEIRITISPFNDLYNSKNIQELLDSNILFKKLKSRYLIVDGTFNLESTLGDITIIKNVKDGIEIFNYNALIQIYNHINNNNRCSISIKFDKFNFSYIDNYISVFKEKNLIKKDKLSFYEINENNLNELMDSIYHNFFFAINSFTLGKAFLNISIEDMVKLKHNEVIERYYSDKFFREVINI
jgi:hypothetical protein